MRWFWVMLLSSSSFAAPLVLEGDLPDGGPDFVMIPFEVPAGTEEISVTHPKLQPENILDYGVFDPSGFRGWGGGNSEAAVVGRLASSRSYLTGPMPAGQWSVLIGKAKIVVAPARYRLEIELRTTATLPAQTQRTPYRSTRLGDQTRWYAGDLHVHSRESGDASPTMDEVAAFARSRMLDFVEYSEHNTTSQLDFFGDVQPRHPEVLMLPGVEFTTYAGHANGIGATSYVDHRLGYGDWTLDQAISQFATQDVVFSLNHPLLDLGQTCIGCAWKHPFPRDHAGAVEIGTGGFDKTGLIFGKNTIAWWERLVAQGLHLAPVGGSDDHSGGTGTGSFDSAIGSPTTMVFASALDAAAIVEGIRKGHTVVKLQGPTDPMVDLRIGDALVGDTVQGDQLVMKITVTGGVGSKLVVFKDGAQLSSTDVTADPFELADIVAPGRYRAEAQFDGQPRTVTANLWLEPSPAPPPKTGCGCSSGGDVILLLLVLLRVRGRWARAGSACGCSTVEGSVVSLLGLLRFLRRRGLTS